MEGIAVKPLDEHVGSAREGGPRRSWHLVRVERGHRDRLDFLPQKLHGRNFALDEVLFRCVRGVARRVFRQPDASDDEAVVWCDKLEAAPVLASRERARPTRAQSAPSC